MAGMRWDMTQHDAAAEVFADEWRKGSEHPDTRSAFDDYCDRDGIPASERNEVWRMVLNILMDEELPPDMTGDDE